MEARALKRLEQRSPKKRSFPKAIKTVSERSQFQGVYEQSASIDDHLASLKSDQFQHFRSGMVQPQQPPGSGQPIKIKSNQVRRAAVNMEGDNIRVRELEPESTSPRPHPYPNAEMRHYRMIQLDSPSAKTGGSPDVRRSKPLRGANGQFEDPLGRTMN